MTKKRKKVHQQHNEKIARAHHKNEFMRKLKYYVTLFSDKDVFGLIPQKFLDVMYEMRCYSVRIRNAEGHDIPSDVLNHSKMIVAILTKNIFLPIKGRKEEVSIHDFFTIIVSFYSVISVSEDRHFSTSSEVKKRTQLIDYVPENLQLSMEYLTGVIATITLMYSDLRQRIYYMKTEIINHLEGRKGRTIVMDMYSSVPNKMQINVDNDVRPAYQVSWGMNNIDPRLLSVTLEAKDLGVSFITMEKPFDVYIQSHALLRLEERLDNVYPGYLHFFLFDSFRPATYIRNKKGDIMIEYKLQGKKVGYMPISIEDGVFLVHTFLFLTNNGTPEGEKLRENTGLDIEDKKYLTIDKLSAFMSSDIADNSQVKQIFIDAGCGSLFELDDSIMCNPEKIKTRSIASLISEYLGINEEDQSLNDEHNWEKEEESYEISDAPTDDNPINQTNEDQE